MSKWNCQFTARDFNILDAMMRGTSACEVAFRRLLRSKMAMATLHEAVGPDVVTIDSRVEFTVNGGAPKSRILIHAEERSVPGLTLSITTLRGLALLGLRVSSTVLLAKPDGVIEELFLHRVAYQPWHATRHRSPTPLRPGREQPEVPCVVDLGPYLRSARKSLRNASQGLEDDDPGPQAA